MAGGRPCSHTELTARVVALETLVKANDLRYEERDKAQDEAVAAALASTRTMWNYLIGLAAVAAVAFAYFRH